MGLDSWLLTRQFADILFWGFFFRVSTYNYSGFQGKEKGGEGGGCDLYKGFFFWTQSCHGPDKKEKKKKKKRRVEIAIFRSYFPCMLPIYCGFKKILTYSQIWLNSLMIIVGSPISKKLGKKPKKKKKKIGYQGNENYVKKEISLLFTDTNSWPISCAYYFLGLSLGVPWEQKEWEEREREKIVQVTKSLFLTPVVLHMYVCMCVKCVR